jgi:transposase
MADQDTKLRTLQQQGTLNPHPKAVRDPLFLQDEFFDPRDLVQVKYEMLRRVRTEGQSVTDAVADFGFSRPSFYQAQSAFEQDGLAGLVPHKRGPKQAHKLTEEILTFIRELRQKEPAIRPPDLVNRIQERFGITVHPRSIERSLLRHQKNSAERGQICGCHAAGSDRSLRATAL